ncbi:hypothetical protein ACJMK2_006924 [Sinanodonta woodiana]|uniref:Endothelin-converting enzyme 1 n=1 Tax=Sinanodonta woodiana TaxID=1069815 RepID=A0ABD3VUN4_SINWO
MPVRFVILSTCTDENELLNGSESKTSMKMQDAPFERTGSEDDIIDYEDSSINCDQCHTRRKCTLLEKLLVLLLVVFLVIVIALAISLGKEKTMDKEAPSFCTRKECLNAASDLLRAMDLTANPCEDFHQYACGGWLKETPIPPGYPIWDRFQEVSYKNLYVLKTLLESNKMSGSAERKAQAFYESCMGESRMSRDQTLDNFRQLLQRNLSSDNFNTLLENVHNLDVWPFCRLITGPDERDPERVILKIEMGDSSFPYNVFLDENENIRPTEETINSSSNEAYISPASYTVPSPSTARIPRANKTQLISDYKQETSVLLRLFWNMTLDDAANMADDVFKLEQALLKAHGTDVHIHNRSHVYHTVKVKDLQQNCSVLNWILYLNSILRTQEKQITDETDVVLLHDKAFNNVCQVVETYRANKTLESILFIYLKLRLARSIKPYFDISTFQANIDPDEEVDLEGEHWRRCTFYTNKAMGFATGAIYVNGSEKETSVAQIKQLVDYIKRAFKDYLLRNIWIDDKTQALAAKKIDEIIEKVSYPGYILNSTFLDQYYEKFTIGSDWFQNVIHWRSFAVRNMGLMYWQKYNRSSWINSPMTVESDYSPERNDILFPIAMLHPPIYTSDGPSPVNFGAIGSIIGHEITHAFDILGRQYDGIGRLMDWWDPTTLEQFNVTTQCMREQYNSYHVNEYQLDGARTLDENIADNGGIRAAHIAYELWLNEHGNQERLPGIPLTDHQIFYVSFAQMFCSIWKPGSIKDFLIRETHSPGPFRIQGVLSNSEAFSQVFQCPYTSKYNPDIKCRVW